jgi:hypothetical protein
MVGPKTTFFTVGMLAVISACTFHTSKQNPAIAASSAIEFVKVALIEQDIDRAYVLLDPEFQAIATKEKFVQVIRTMNSPVSPKVITATEFEPIPGQEGMNIYLTGENGREELYYRIPMKGSEEKGYKPAGVFRGQGQYAPSETRRPLQVKVSTGE